MTVVLVTESNLATAAFTAAYPVSLKFGSTHSRREAPAVMRSVEETDGAAVVVVVDVDVAIVVVVVPEVEGATVSDEGGLVVPLENDGVAVTTMAAMDTEIRRRLADAPVQAGFIIRSRRLYLSIIPITEW